MKAFALLEEAPAPLVSTGSGAIAATTAQLSAACAGDRRRGPGIARSPRPGTTVERCSTARSSTGRGCRAAAPAQRCATPTVSGSRAGKTAPPLDRRAAVPGGFLHR